MNELLKASEYLQSFADDQLCRVVGIDSFGDRIVIADCQADFLLIVGAYVESTWGITVTISGALAKR